jgi:hypothetical protein
VALRQQVIGVLGQLRSSASTPYLLKPLLIENGEASLKKAAEEALVGILGRLPTRASALDYLYDHASAYLEGRLPGRLDHEGLITLWVWDQEQQEVVAYELDGRSASLLVATRIAAEMYSLDTEVVEHRRLFLASLLESAKLAVGIDQPLPVGEGTAHAIASAAGAQALEEVLAFASDNGFGAAAIGAMEVLGDIADERMLDSAEGRPRQITLALRHPDRRIQFAALSTIIRWDPRVPYPGSSYLPETLVYFASTAGTRRVLIGHPRTEKAQTLVGMLKELGFDADTAHTGNEVSRHAIANPDYEFLLLSDSLDRPEIGALIQQLRRDSRSARLPIGVTARETNLRRMSRYTEQDSRAETFPRPFDAVGMAFQVRRLLAMNGQDAVDPDQRLRHAQTALDYLAQLAEHPERYSFYDILGYEDAIVQTLGHPALATRVSRVLGFLGTPEAQRVLVDVASQNARHLPERQAAAAAFDKAVARRGILLSRSEILTQYDRYNRSATLDRETQKVLGAILDTIEAPSQTKD